MSFAIDGSYYGYEPADPGALIPYDECTCTEGMQWNNADPTSGMGDECTECDFQETNK